ncbi:hypothetical protein [Streptomyces sp. NPDC059371]
MDHRRRLGGHVVGGVVHRGLSPRTGVAIVYVEWNVVRDMCGVAI